jgi:type VI secretion system protein ImpA
MTLAPTKTFDIQAIAAPLAGDLPGGDAKIYSRQLRSRFSELRNPTTSCNPCDPLAESTTAEPDWQAIRTLAIDVLKESSKDLRVVCHLIEALVHLEGLRGLQRGLELLGTVLRQGWDYLVPLVDPDDDEIRSAPIANLLDDPDRGPRLPMALRCLPLVGGDGIWISLQDATRRGTSDEEKQQIRRAIAATEPTVASDLVVAHRAATAQLITVQSILADRMGPNAPGLTNLSESLDLLGRWLINCFGDAPTKPAQELVAPRDLESTQQPVIRSNPPGDELPTGDTADVVRMSIRMRNDAYKNITEAANVLQQIEPHSPIPYMIHRAVRLGQMSFPDLVGKIVREESALQSLRGECGLPSEQGV